MVSNTQGVQEPTQEATSSAVPKETPNPVFKGDRTDYELVIVITPEATEEKLEARLNNISQYITDHGGTVSSLDKWGKKRLAYPIKKSVEGNYFLFKYLLPPEASRVLENNLRISEDVLRYLVVKPGA